MGGAYLWGRVERGTIIEATYVGLGWINCGAKSKAEEH